MLSDALRERAGGMRAKSSHLLSALVALSLLSPTSPPFFSTRYYALLIVLAFAKPQALLRLQPPREPLALLPFALAGMWSQQLHPVRGGAGELTSEPRPGLLRTLFLSQRLRGPGPWQVHQGTLNLVQHPCPVPCLSAPLMSKTIHLPLPDPASSPSPHKLAQRHPYFTTLPCCPQLSGQDSNPPAL